MATQAQTQLQTSVVEIVELPRYSMFQSTPIYRIESTVPNTYDIIPGMIRDPVIADTTDQIYVVDQTTQNRLDLIANLFYGQSELWWVLAMVNNLIDAHVVPYQTRLRIPLRSRLTNLQIIQN